MFDDHLGDISFNSLFSDATLKDLRPKLTELSEYLGTSGYIFTKHLAYVGVGLLSFTLIGKVLKTF